MVRDFKKPTYYRRRVERLIPPKSKRPHRYLLEEAQKLRKRVVVISTVILLVFLIYVFFYSDVFKFKIVNLDVTENLEYEEVKEKINDILDDNLALIFPQDNYFLSKKNYIKKEFQEPYTLSDLEITKKFPKTLNIKAVEKLGQSVWVTNERVYLINLEGTVVRELPIVDLVNSRIPVIYDLSNTKIEVKDKTLDLRVIGLIFSLYSNFSNYQLPGIELDYFKVDNSNVNYIKLVTKQGFEIHLNTILSLEDQIYKLKKSLEAGKIDLNNIVYINLRIENQVIYK